MSIFSERKKPSVVILLDFALVVFIFVVILLGVLSWSVGLSRRSGRDVTKIPSEVDFRGRVGTD